MSEVVATAQQGLTGKYQPYPEYKDSGVEWLGEVPIDWGASRHKYIATFAKGKNPKELFDEVGIGRHQYLAMGFLRGLEVPKYCDLDSSTILVMENQILIIWDGSNAGEFVKATHGVLSSTMAAVTTNSNIHDGFYWYYCKSIEPEMRRHANGMGIPHVDGDELKAIVIPQPALEEQRSIAAFLDYETARIDRLIAQQQRLIELLKEKRQAVISHAVTKGLNPDAPMKNSGVEWLGQVPEHWGIRAINQATKKITNGYVGPTRDILVDNGVPYIQATHIKNGRVNFDDGYFVTKSWSNKKHKSILMAGDVLIVQTGAGTGDIGLVTEFEQGYNCHALIILQPMGEVIDGSYLSLILRSAYGQSVLYSIRTGGMHPHLNCSEVKFVKIPVPSLEEQRAIYDFVLKINDVYSRLMDVTTKQIALMQERRTALISAAVTGKIDLRGWTQPAEEAAE
ncbi:MULTISPECIES: restriction endonuclease subunit S [Aeromonas]|nr:MULTISPECIES: restriction endonuclease subunit S [Aeromonas]